MRLGTLHAVLEMKFEEHKLEFNDIVKIVFPRSKKIKKIRDLNSAQVIKVVDHIQYDLKIPLGLRTKE